MDMAKQLLFLWIVLMVLPPNSQESKVLERSNFEKILSIWKLKLRPPPSIVSNLKTKLNSVDIQTLLDKMALRFESLWTTPEQAPLFINSPKYKVKQNRLSQFLYNISTYLQNQELHEQEAESWDGLVNQFLQVPAERSSALPIIKLQDFLVSLRGSQNWSFLLRFIQNIFRSISSRQNTVQLLGQNWEMLSGLLDTLFQAFLSGTLTQSSTTLQGVLCSIMGQRNCGILPEFMRLLLPFEANNWRPVVNVQTGSSVRPHGNYFRPFSLLSESLRDKNSNSSRPSPGSAQEEVQNVLEILYRSREKEKGTKVSDSDSTTEDAVWGVLEDLRYSLMKKMERSVYDNLNRKVSRMAGTLMHRVSSVIGIPHADQDGRCSVGNLQQLLLWGIKHNITWNTQTLGFTSTSFPSTPPILTCSKPAVKIMEATHNITKRSSTDFWEEPQPYTEVLEAVCNDTIPGLPGISNFTVFLYCHVYNATGYSVDTSYNLQAACSDAAWYLSSMEEDSFWVWVCREYFPLEFNITVCKNSSFQMHNQESRLMTDLCTNVSNTSEATRELRNNIRCSDMWQGISMNPKALKTCLFDNKTIMMEKLCSNDSLSGMSEDSRTWLSRLCNRQTVKTYITSSTCNYKTWESKTFSNATLVEECKGVNIQDFIDLVCRNASLYFALKSVHPWIVDQCWKNTSLHGRCFLQRLADVLPLSSSFDSSQLCRNPISYIIGLVSQLSQCDSESYGWAVNVQYLLKVLDFLFSLSDSDQIGKETRDRLGEAILLSSLLDNTSFWTSFKMNSSISILHTVELYLEKESSESDKEDLLSCFSPVLWDLIQKEENANAFEILLQEYLQMPREGFQKVLLSAENNAVERFISLMHRSWPKIQTSPDEKGLETLTSMFIQKFPLLTPQIFVDLSQFIPFMSISDIVSFPITLLANQSVLDAIKIHSQEMKVTQKRAFAKHFLQADIFGEVPSWPPHFLRSIQPLLPFLPYCHFVQLSSDQIKLLADGWKDGNVGMIQGRYVAQSLMNISKDVDKVQRLGHLICYLTYEDLQQFQPFHYPLGTVEKRLLECVSLRTLSHRGRLAYSLVSLLKRTNLQTLDIDEMTGWKSLLPEMGVTFFQSLQTNFVTSLLPQLQASDLSAAQALSILTNITSKLNVAEQVLCELHPLLPVLSPEHLRSLSTSLLARVCQCLRPSLPLLTAAQKAALMQSLRKHIQDVELWPEQFSCLLPFAPLKLLHLDTQILLRNMSLYGEVAWMPQQTQFLWRKIQAGANLTKNTILSLGTLANGIECDSLQQLNTLSEIRDVVKYLQGIPSGLRKSLRKCILEEIQKRPELSWEDTGWMGPEFITDLPVKLIDRLSNESVKLFLEHAHKYPKSFMELSSHKKSILAQRALHILQIPIYGEITAQDLDLLGPLVGFIGEEDISRINRKHLLFHLEELKSYCLSEEFSGNLGKILTEDELLGHPTYWTHIHIQQLGRLIFYLTPENIHFVSKDVLGRDTLEWLLESQREWEDSEIGKICTTQSSLVQEQIRRNKMSLVSSLTRSGFRGIREPIPKCMDMRVTFPSAWSPSQISGMLLSEFEGCLVIITQDLSFSTDQAKAALAKAKQVYGPVKTMSPAQILQLGHLVTYMTERDLNDINISDWGLVSFLGRMENWTWKQMKTLAFSALRQNKKGSSDLDLMELTALGHLLCGLGVDELKKINSQEFSQASVFVGTLKLKCTEAQMETLAEHLTYNSAFGLVSRWGPEIFTEVGTLAAGLPDIVLSSLIRDQIQGLTPDAISLISAPKFAVVFSPAQLSCFTSDQATAVTPQQYEHLSYQQRQAISSAQYDGDIHQDLRGENSVRSLAAWHPVLYIMVLLLLLH
ncbi:stereocilin isoform X2 [Hyla sarda]|uniref:stereocilin isoform X2 n=1 Tax=Hyla sarda TaxID=327740 RepID=UPI0024C37502|nr:stereocilin isoform X2 [Hyla sarda]